MNFIIDTSAYSEAQRGNRAVIDLMNQADQIYMPTIVEAELRAGYSFGTKEAENCALLHKFLKQPSVSVINIGLNTPKVFAQIYLELRSDGFKIGQNDLWIASLARELQLPLLTLDHDFSRVKYLKLVPVA